MMYSLDQISFTSIADLQSKLLRLEFSVYDLVLAYLNKIRQTQNLNIFIETFDSEILQKARELDEKITKKERLGALFGVVVSIKDVYCYKGHKVSAASAFLQNYEASYTATCIHRLLNEDALIIGRVNCDEFAMGASNEHSIYGPVRNPHHIQKVPGGSSGGSAASVAAGLCMVSIGSDTGGSVRQPADFCGVVGLKPTYGRISRYGLIAYASSLDSVGFMTGSVEDVAPVLACMSGIDGFDSTCVATPEEPHTQEPLPQLKIAYLEDVLHYPALEPSIKENFVKVIHTFDQKHSVESIYFPLLSYLVPTYYIISCAEAASNLSRYDGIRYGVCMVKDEVVSDLRDFYKKNRTAGFGAEVKKRIMLGNFVLSSGYYDAYYTKAQHIRKVLTALVRDIFTQYDVILMPNSPCLAWDIGKSQEVKSEEMYLSDIFSVLANLVGVPSLSIPSSVHTTGLPIGFQMMGAPFAEQKLISLAKDFATLSKHTSS